MTPASGDDDEPPLTLQPVDPETEAARRRMRDSEQSPLQLPRDEVPAAPRWQFSLAQLLLANTVFAILLALCQVLAPGLIAGICGLAAFLMLWIVTVYEPDQPKIHMVAWGLILLYLCISAIALWRV